MSKAVSSAELAEKLARDVATLQRVRGGAPAGEYERWAAQAAARLLLQKPVAPARGKATKRRADGKQKRNRGPDVARLRQVIEVVNLHGGPDDRGAMTAAAVDLGVTPAAVSKAVKRWRELIRSAGHDNGRSVRAAQTLPAGGVSEDAGPADRGTGRRLRVRRL